jgi:hypothetical protein
MCVSFAWLAEFSVMTLGVRILNFFKSCYHRQLSGVLLKEAEVQK